MKILDKYLLKSFLITFATVFVILFFIFVLQVVWLFISELAGKDLDFIMILKFLLFKMPSIIPLVLPLSVLLASIMTFGSLAENYEFAAMKQLKLYLLFRQNLLNAYEEDIPLYELSTGKIGQPATNYKPSFLKLGFSYDFW